MPDESMTLSRNNGFTILDGSGRQVAAIDPEAAMTMMRMLGISPNGGGGGGGNQLAQLGTGVQLGVTAVEAIGIRDDVEDAQDALHQLHEGRKALYKYLVDSSASGAGTIDGVKLAELQRNIDVAQDELDRAQTRAQNKGITILWTQVFGAGAQILGNMSSGVSNALTNLFGGGGGGGYSGFADALIGGGLGALLASLWTRRERSDREDRGNVPPLPIR